MDDRADTTDTTDADESTPTHPLERAHRFFQKAAPVIQEVNDTIERNGGPEGIAEMVAERANVLVQQVDEAVANATAIEGEVIERPGRPAHHPAPPPATPVVAPRRAARPWVAFGFVVAAATYGALRLQRRA